MAIVIACGDAKVWQGADDLWGWECPDAGPAASGMGFPTASTAMTNAIEVLSAMAIQGGAYSIHCDSRSRIAAGEVAIIQDGAGWVWRAPRLDLCGVREPSRWAAALAALDAIERAAVSYHRQETDLSLGALMHEFAIGTDGDLHLSAIPAAQRDGYAIIVHEMAGGEHAFYLPRIAAAGEGFDSPGMAVVGAVVLLERIAHAALALEDATEAILRDVAGPLYDADGEWQSIKKPDGARVSDEILSDAQNCLSNARAARTARVYSDRPGSEPRA